MVNYENDYQYGEQQQKHIKPLLEKHFGFLTEGQRYSKYDFENEDICIEVKSRKNRHDAYPNTLLTANKITDTNKTIIFIFNFTDKIMYIKYDREQFCKYEAKMFSRSRQMWDEKIYIYIPIEDLKEFV